MRLRKIVTKSKESGRKWPRLALFLECLVVLWVALVTSQMSSYANTEDCETIMTGSQIQSVLEQQLEEMNLLRGGHKRRAIWYDTSSPEKLVEARRMFGRFGIEVLHSPAIDSSNKQTLARMLLSLKRKNLTFLSFLTEQSNFVETGSEYPVALKQGNPAQHLSMLTVYTLENDSLSTHQYTHRIPGEIDLTRKKGTLRETETSNLFLVGPDKKWTFEDLKSKGVVVTATEMTISKYLIDHVYYKTLRSLSSRSPIMNRVVDFDLDPSEFMKTWDLDKNIWHRHLGILNLVNKALSEGLFFRAPQNRRQSNFHISGLNGGIPLTPQSDSDAEISYLIHDFTHELIPDLLFSDGKNPLLSKQVYIIYRMLSEAIAVTISDLVFAYTHSKGANASMEKKSRPLQLFDYLQLDFVDNADRTLRLKKLMKANIDLMLAGNESEFRKLLDGSPAALEALAKYKKSMTPLFVGDYLWNARNFDNLAQNAAKIERWKQKTLPLLAAQGMERQSLEDIITGLQLEKVSSSWLTIVDRLFEKIFETKIQPIFSAEYIPLVPQEKRIARAVTKYMAGQMAVFSQFQWLEESSIFQDKIKQLLHSKRNGMNYTDACAIRAVYDEYLDMLLSRNLITLDDYWTWKEVYPFFEPYYLVFEDYKNMEISSIASTVLGGNKVEP